MAEWDDVSIKSLLCGGSWTVLLPSILSYLVGKGVSMCRGCHSLATYLLSSKIPKMSVIKLLLLAHCPIKLHVGLGLFGLRKLRD